MDGSREHRRRNHVLTAALAILLGSWTSTRTVVEPLSARDALQAAGKRLSRTFSPGDLTEIASRADRVLAVLNRTERDALARGYLEFRVESPADVYIAAPRGSKPFWLDDLGFIFTEATLRDERITWDLYRRTYPAGSVRLGVNGLDRSPPAHYAVLVRSLDGAPRGVELSDPDGWQISTASPGECLERIGGRPISDWPGTLKNVALIRTDHDRRHATMLAHARVWKTHEISSLKPDQVVVSFGADASDSLTFTWRTSPGITTSAVKIRRFGDLKIRVVSSHFEAIAIPELLNDPVVNRHVARVEGLDPETSYEYAIGEAASRWTPIKTPPHGKSDVCLLYMGDPQCGLEGWGKLLGKARRARPDASALLIAGDLVDRGNERTNWDHFFLRAKGVFDVLPVMPAVGNHEYLDRGPWLYRGVFALPENGPRGVPSDLVYSFEIGDAFIAVLDSTAAVTDPNQAKIQAEWLDEKLSKTRKTWKLVMFHHPLHASHPSRESPGLRAAWTPVFDKHRVDLVLQGHDHAYLRTYPLRGGRRVSSAAGGTVYVVSVSGDKFYDQRPAETTEVGFTHVSTYQTIDLKSIENRLIYRCFDAEGRERDAFTIEKPAGSLVAVP